MTAQALIGPGPDASRPLARPTVLIAGGVLLLLFLLALLAPAIVPNDPYLGRLQDRLLPPSLEFPLGTDAMGRCLFSRLLMALRVTPAAASLLVLISLAVGTAIGLACGYVGGPVDRVLMRVAEGILVFPAIGLALVLSAFLGIGLWSMVWSLAAVHWADYARLMRNITVAERVRPYVLAATALGTPPPAILVRHLLPNTLAPLAVMATFSLSWAVLSFAGLSFLGLGAEPGTPELGLMIAEARSHMREHPRLMLVPGLVIVAMLIALNLLGDGLRDRFR